MANLTLNINLPDELSRVISGFTIDQLQKKFEDFIKEEIILQKKSKQALQKLLKNKGILQNTDLSDINKQDLHLQE